MVYIDLRAVQIYFGDYRDLFGTIFELVQTFSEPINIIHLDT